MMDTVGSSTAADATLKRGRDPGNGHGLSMRRARGTSRRDWREGSRKIIRKRRKPLGEKLADWFRAFIAFLFSNVGIVCLVVGYTIAGAFIFEAIEGSHNRKIANGNDVTFSRNKTAQQLWKLTAKENIFSETIWKTKVNKILQKYQEIVINAAKEGWDGTDSMNNRKWSFAGAFLYSLTVITTIGYGNTCPRTMWGKVITIGYAIGGMPIFLLFLSNSGDILAKSFKWIYARCCLCRSALPFLSGFIITITRIISMCSRCRKRPRLPRDQLSDQTCQKNTWQVVNMQQTEGIDTVSIDGESETMSKTTESDQDDDNDDSHITVPITLCLGIMVGYICGGALLFSKWEDWDFLDGSYFCFVSLSTIGFGDLVPGIEQWTHHGGQGIELSFIFCAMYLMLGMALIAMCFNLMQEEVIAKMRSFTRTIKHVLRCDR